MLNFYVMVGVSLFVIGLIGVLMRRNLVLILLFIELMLNSVNIIFVAVNHYLAADHGRMFVFFVLTVSAAEVAVGLALVISLYKRISTVDVDDLRDMKW